MTPARSPRDAPTVIFHDLGQALAALAVARDAHRAVHLVSAPGAADYAGAGWFIAVMREATRQVPDAEAVWWLDCADRPGRVLGALRAGIDRVIFTGRPAVAAKLSAIAAARGAMLRRRRCTGALDLGGVRDALSACHNLLAS